MDARGQLRATSELYRASSLSDTMAPRIATWALYAVAAAAEVEATQRLESQAYFAGKRSVAQRDMRFRGTDRRPRWKMQAIAWA